MSTRCNIIVKDNKQSVTVYHHCDGYPEGVGEELKTAVKIYKGERTANAFASFLNSEDKSYEIWGVDHSIAGDIEYLYFVIINADNITVECWSVTWDFKDELGDNRWTFTAEEVTGSLHNDKEFSVTFNKAKETETEEHTTAELLAVATDDELIAELKRRGYTGTLTISKNINL